MYPNKDNFKFMKIVISPMKIKKLIIENIIATKKKNI